jgi:hemoglobin-like flavoprotein
LRNDLDWVGEISVPTTDSVNLVRLLKIVGTPQVCITMGAATSFVKAVKCDDEKKPQVSVRSMRLHPTFRLYNGVEPSNCLSMLNFNVKEEEGGLKFKVDRFLVNICDLSWRMVATSTNHVTASKNVGLFAFCERFFYHMTAFDIDSEAPVVPKFQPRSNSRCPSRGALLMKIVKYMLSIPNDKFPARAKIRRLGRAHASRGIRHHHFTVFAKAFMCALADVLSTQFRIEIQRAWSQMLTFFVYEMTVENVIFVRHHTRVVDAEQCDFDGQRRNSTSYYSNLTSTVSNSAEIMDEIIDDSERGIKTHVKGAPLELSFGFPPARPSIIANDSGKDSMLAASHAVKHVGSPSRSMSLPNLGSPAALKSNVVNSSNKADSLEKATPMTRFDASFEEYSCRELQKLDSNPLSTADDNSSPGRVITHGMDKIFSSDDYDVIKGEMEMAIEHTEFNFSEELINHINSFRLEPVKSVQQNGGDTSKRRVADMWQQMNAPKLDMNVGGMFDAENSRVGTDLAIVNPASINRGISDP